MHPIKKSVMTTTTATNSSTYSLPALTVRNILYYTYGIVPIVAGADKFTNILTHWTDYLKGVESMLPMSASSFMMIVGVIEIVAGILVFAIPKVGAWIVTLWLLCIAIVLIMGGFYDVAVRDIVMAISAFCLAKLSERRPMAAR